MKKCPYCKEKIKEEAIKCKHCESSLEDKNNEEKQVSSSKFGIGRKILRGLGWFFGVVFVLGGISELFTEPVIGITNILAGLIIIPAFVDWLKNRFGLNLSGGKIVLLFFGIFFLGIGLNMYLTNGNSSVGNKDKQKQVEKKEELPEYQVMGKVKEINTESTYNGIILIDESVKEIPPEEFIDIARRISKKEGFDKSFVGFYTTREAHKVDSTPKEDAEALNNGCIGTLYEQERFEVCIDSDYYDRHLGDSNKEQDWVIK